MPDLLLLQVPDPWSVYPGQAGFDPLEPTNRWDEDIWSAKIDVSPTKHIQMHIDGGKDLSVWQASLWIQDFEVDEHGNVTMVHGPSVMLRNFFDDHNLLQPFVDHAAMIGARLCEIEKRWKAEAP